MRFIYGDKNEKKLKEVYPLIEMINEEYDKLENLSDNELKDKVIEIKEKIRKELDDYSEKVDKLRTEYKTEKIESKKNKLHDLLNSEEEKFRELTEKVLDGFIPEVFAIVKDTCRRLREMKFKYDVRGDEEEWFMIPFDVQLIGGVVLHKGQIAEMATGEGKTLVATLPLFLNALTGRPVFLVTVNDYLAQRDSEWMSPIFEFHNMNVGVVYSNMSQEDRKAAYDCEIVYGTNSQFGFDYLRDNMAVSKENIVQKDLFFSIVDEIDSALIDEARTPLILSGPVEQSKNYYDEFKSSIEELVKNQKRLVRRLLSEAETEIDKDKPNWEKIAEKFLIIKRGDPKNKKFNKLMQDSELKDLTTKYEGEKLRNKNLHEIDEFLFYTIEENKNSCDLNEKGHEIISGKDSELFVMNSLDEELEKINKKYSGDQKLEKEREIQNKFIIKNEKLHNISQLLKAYSLFEKDNDYIIQDNKVVIVDEFTGRSMAGRRFSDGLHQAIEAKERVKIQDATQTFATITLQNFFKKFDKLAGMTGTAETEEGEFMEIYDLPVVVIPTNKPITRYDHDDLIYLTKKEKYEAIIREVKYWHEKQKPVLIGTVTVEVSELISKLLKRNGIKHNVLNAKQHEAEAQIVADAGEPGVVTIATNMAGRGTDIKLGEGVIQKETEYYSKNTNLFNMSEEYPYGGPFDGLHVIGTERHESRRIDRQLRGRAGRQGDPGTSRFYLSMEDKLMRLFGSNKIAPMMTKLGLEKGEAITHPWMTKSVSKAQKKVETHNFEIRKQLLEYDEIQNQQREVIYSYRRRVLQNDDIHDEVMGMIEDTIYDLVSKEISGYNYEEEWPLDKIADWLNSYLRINVTEDDIAPEKLTKETLFEKVKDVVFKKYQRKIDVVGLDNMKLLENHSLLSVVDTEWRDHLHEIDHVKEGIGLRAYAQKDPLIEYKKETFTLFEELIARINRKVTEKVFNEVIVTRENDFDKLKDQLNALHDDMDSFASTNKNVTGNSGEEGQRKIQPRIVIEKVGRNEPCPCGSGKKFKKCCGKK